MRAYISKGTNVLEVLEELRDNIRALPQDIEGFARKIFNSQEVKKFIVEANIRLLEKGLRPDLTPISKQPEGNQNSKFYERYTIYNRDKEGLQTQFVDLYKTGFFYESLKVKSGSKELIEISTDPKAEELERVWGDILGISSEDLVLLIEMLRPKIIEFVRKKLKGDKSSI